VRLARAIGFAPSAVDLVAVSTVGYPDITAVRRDRILFIELKAEKGRLSEEQGAWLADLGAAGAEAFCWRPSDWPAIEETLR
jgi:hypothetical protein